METAPPPMTNNSNQQAKGPRCFVTPFVGPSGLTMFAAICTSVYAMIRSVRSARDRERGQRTDDAARLPRFRTM